MPILLPLNMNQIEEYWIVFCYGNADFAGNAEPQNKRRSQNGAVLAWLGPIEPWGISKSANRAELQHDNLVFISGDYGSGKTYTIKV